MDELLRIIKNEVTNFALTKKWGAIELSIKFQDGIPEYLDINETKRIKFKGYDSFKG